MTPQIDFVELALLGQVWIDGWDCFRPAADLEGH